MIKKLLVAGLLGGVTLLATTLVSNSILPFRHEITMKRIPDERLVHEVLRQSLVEHGRYVCLLGSPDDPPAEGASYEMPVFSIYHNGLGHPSAGRVMIFDLAIAFAAPALVAWLLAAASSRILDRYGRRVLFVAVIGAVIALVGGLQGYDIESYSLTHATVLAFHRLAEWTLVGLVLAAWVRPERAG